MHIFPKSMRLPIGAKSNRAREIPYCIFLHQVKFNNRECVLSLSCIGYGKKQVLDALIYLDTLLRNSHSIDFSTVNNFFNRKSINFRKINIINYLTKQQVLFTLYEGLIQKQQWVLTSSRFSRKCIPIVCSTPFLCFADQAGLDRSDTLLEVSVINVTRAPLDEEHSNEQWCGMSVPC